MIKPAYEQAKLEIRDRIYPPGRAGLEKARRYSLLDQKALLAIRPLHLRPDTLILISGSTFREEASFRSDIDMAVASVRIADPGVQPYITEIEEVTGRTVQCSSGTIEEIRHNFLNNAWERLILIDSAPLGISGTTVGSLGLSRLPEAGIKQYESALFFVLRNLVFERPLPGPREKIDMKHGPGALKYFSLFRTAMRLLSICPEPELSDHFSEYLDVLLGIKDDAHFFYGEETNLIGHDLKASPASAAYIQRYGGLRETTEHFFKRTVELFHSKLSAMLVSAAKGIPELTGHDPIMLLEDASGPGDRSPQEGDPEFVLSFYSALSADKDALGRVFNIASPAYWTTFFFLGENPNTPKIVLDSLVKMGGYLNRDIRLRAVRNPGADNSIWEQLVNDPHPPVARVCRDRLQQ
ncbi:MAG: hypothetical protein WC490_02320 [Candidatus Margulisiibacteriota bacterium]